VKRDEILFLKHEVPLEGGDLDYGFFEIIDNCIIHSK